MTFKQRMVYVSVECQVPKQDLKLLVKPINLYSEPDRMIII